MSTSIMQCCQIVAIVVGFEQFSIDPQYAI